MELLKLHRRRSRLSDVAYIGLNVGLAIAIFVITISTENVWLPLLIILLGKWRVFAVRPRFWRQNVLANSVDAIVGISHVLFLYAASGELWLQIALTIGYVIWLLFIKPRSKHIYVVAQAGIALFLGITSVSMLAYGQDALVFVAGIWVIGYASARHVLLHYETPMTAFFSLVWALFVAELGWFSYSWLFAYQLPNSGDLKLSQLALIVTLLGFVTERGLASRHAHGAVRRSDLVLPFVFATLLIAILVLFFSRLTAANGL